MYDDKEAKKVFRREQDWEKQDRGAVEGAVAALMQHRDGRKFLWWLLQRGKAIGTNAFTGNALSTSFNCGEQNVGQQILALITQVDAAGFAKLIEEEYNEQRAREMALDELRSRGRDGDGGTDTD